MTQPFSRTLVILTACLATGAHAAGDPARGKEKSATCAACHGADGLGTLPSFPKLAGQYASYLEHALGEYRAGRRQNAVMGPQATNLSDADIADLAAYFSSLPGPLATVPRGP